MQVWCTGDGLTYYQDVWIPGRMDSSVESMLWFGDSLLTAGFSGELASFPCQFVGGGLVLTVHSCVDYVYFSDTRE